ncbi:helix-turn-helix domain-containing protein [Victivallis sp. Marseille-Q1083]|uniref:helix-turn-helix domain-containing protein n=1 Tax=Victivallis sp. Marseille-Q1083 TaxID=2717288 RepID=UPI00158E7978|nr:AraC family transcriptional regulator [Victivallis sp. Marseille-Q1083]
MKNINDSSDSRHQVFQLSGPAVEILLCRRDVLNDWQIGGPPAPYWRLYRPWSNTGLLHYHDQTLSMRAGEVWVIAPQTEFNSSLTGPLDKFYLHFLVDGDLSNCRDFCCRLPPSTALEALVERISTKLQERRNSGFRLEFEVTALVTAALALLPEQYLFQYRPVESGLIAVWRLIQQNPARNYTNAELAEFAKMGLSTFIRRFSSYFGISPQHYVQEQRIRSATLLLIRTELPIADIAESCGFCDIYYFSRMFRKFRGISPLAFRKQQRAGST